MSTQRQATERSYNIRPTSHINYTLQKWKYIRKKVRKQLAATRRGSWPGVQSTSLIMTSLRRDREKRRPPRRMKSSELSNAGNHIALGQLLQNRKWRHLWRHNLGSRWKLQKMTQENFSIGAFYNVTKNQDNPIKTVGWDSFLSLKTPKI